MKVKLLAVGAILVAAAALLAAPANAVAEPEDKRALDGPQPLELPADQTADDQAFSEEEANAALAELEANRFNWESQEIITAMQSLNAAFPDVASHMWVDQGAQTVHGSFNSAAEESRIEDYVAAIRQLSADSQYPVEVSQNTFSVKEQHELVDSLALEPDKWVQALGDKPVAVSAENDGTIVVWFADGDTASEGSPRTVSLNGFVVTIAVEPAFGEAQ